MRSARERKEEHHHHHLLSMSSLASTREDGGGGGAGGGSDDDEGGAGRGGKRQAYAPSTVSLRSTTGHSTVSAGGNGGDDGDDAADWESGIATLGSDEKNDLYAGVDFDPKGDALTPVGYVNLMCKLNLTEMVAVIVTEAGPRVEVEMEELNVHVMKVKETVGESTDVNLSVQYLIVRDKATALEEEGGFSFLTGRAQRADAGRESESPFGPGAAAEPGSIELFAFDPKPLSFPPKFGPRWRPPLGMIVHHKTHMTRFKVRYRDILQ